jgi:hypothetical protein
MAGRFSALHKRLDKVQQQLADFAVLLELENCICLEGIQLDDPEQFETEMNRTCPAHGFRHLGRISPQRWVEDAHRVPERFAELNQLAETYEHRLAQLPQYYIELGHGSERS